MDCVGHTLASKVVVNLSKNNLQKEQIVCMVFMLPIIYLKKIACEIEQISNFFLCLFVLLFGN
jgi:hypothetical protein